MKIAFAVITTGVLKQKPRFLSALWQCKHLVHCPFCTEWVKRVRNGKPSLKVQRTNVLVCCSQTSQDSYVNNNLVYSWLTTQAFVRVTSEEPKSGHQIKLHIFVCFAYKYEGWTIELWMARIINQQFWLIVLCKYRELKKLASAPASSCFLFISVSISDEIDLLHLCQGRRCSSD